MRSSLSAETLEVSGWPKGLTELLIEVWLRQEKFRHMGWPHGQSQSPVGGCPHQGRTHSARSVPTMALERLRMVPTAAATKERQNPPHQPPQRKSNGADTKPQQVSARTRCRWTIAQRPGALELTWCRRDGTGNSGAKAMVTNELTESVTVGRTFPSRGNVAPASLTGPLLPRRFFSESS